MPHVAAFAMRKNVLVSPSNKTLDQKILAHPNAYDLPSPWLRTARAKMAWKRQPEYVRSGQCYQRAFDGWLIDGRADRCECWWRKFSIRDFRTIWSPNCRKAAFLWWIIQCFKNVLTQKPWPQKLDISWNISCPIARTSTRLNTNGGEPNQWVEKYEKQPMKSLAHHFATSYLRSYIPPRPIEPRAPNLERWLTARTLSGC